MGLRTPNLEKEEAIGGSAMIPFEITLVSSYRPSMITFPLPLRVSEILDAFVLQHAIFPHPASSLVQISPCSPVSRWMPLGYEE